MNAANLPVMLSRCETFPGCWVERWQRGPAANARVRFLRRELPTVTTRSAQVNHRWTAEIGSDRTTIDTLEITYCARPEIAARLAA